MKKVKILLVATALVTVAGGTLAFKASKYTEGLKLFTCNAQQKCALALDNITTGIGIEYTSATFTTTTTPIGQPCAGNCSQVVTATVE